MTTCFCGREIKDGDRMHAVAMRTDWGKDDEREPASKSAIFHSFKCVADYFSRLAADHDDRVVVSGDPNQAAQQDEPVVDTRTDSLIRKETL